MNVHIEVGTAHKELRESFGQHWAKEIQQWLRLKKPTKIAAVLLKLLPPLLRAPGP
jgi:hypothetical protein